MTLMQAMVTLIIIITILFQLVVQHSQAEIQNRMPFSGYLMETVQAVVLPLRLKTIYLLMTDIDGDPRAATPELGADEIGGCTPPTITFSNSPTAATASVCASASSQAANFNYSGTTGSPTTYSISGWSGGSFATVTNASL